jgi:AcrR family transcriptional regulator
MTAVGLRERKKEKTRDALARSALRQFAKRGFERVTIEEIVVACDVSPRTFFRYFASKEDVLFAEGDAKRVEFLEALAAQPPKSPPLTALQGAIHSMVGYYEDNRETVLLRHRIVNSTPALRSRVAERYLGWETDVLEHLRSSGRPQRISELELRLVVASATTALRVALDVWIAAKAEPPLGPLLDEAIERLRRGLERHD